MSKHLSNSNIHAISSLLEIYPMVEKAQQLIVKTIVMIMYSDFISVLSDEVSEVTINGITVRRIGETHLHEITFIGCDGFENTEVTISFDEVFDEDDPAASTSPNMYGNRPSCVTCQMQLRQAYERFFEVSFPNYPF